MKIFILGTRGFPNIQGGVEKHCEHLYTLLAGQGVDITVFARSLYFLKRKRIHRWKNIKFIYLWSPKRKDIETFVYTFIASLICIFKRPDIAHFHNIGPALFIPLVKIFRIKTILTYHSINYEHQKWGMLGKFVLKFGEYLGLRFANKIIVISKTTKDFLEKKYNHKDLELIPNGVNIPIRPVLEGDTLKKYNLEHKKYIFTACRIVPEKGLHNLIAAYQKIKNPEFKLVITGDADHETEYSKKFKKSAYGNENIILTGFLLGYPLQELYSNAGLFVLPSYYEGLSMALLEAMSYGLPVLVSDIPQNREVSLPYFRFFPPENVELLSNKMQKLLKNGISKEENEKQNKILNEEYNWDKIAQQTLRVYKRLVNLKIGK